jgi:hypothetical protein
MNEIGIEYNARNFLTSSETINFSRTLLHGINYFHTSRISRLKQMASVDTVATDERKPLVSAWWFPSLFLLYRHLT